MKHIPLNDESQFALISGLWKGDRAPLRPAKVLRGTNFGGDGLLDFDDVVDLEVEERLFADRQLVEGDIIVERSGGGPKQPVGRVAIFTPPDEHAYFSSNFTTTLRVRNRKVFDPDYVALYLHALYLDGATETLQRATTGIRNLDWREFLRFEVPVRSLDEQKYLARLIGGVRAAYRNERELSDVLVRLKQATMRELFMRGLSGEARKETEIGPMPESWEVVRLGQVCNLSTGTTPATKDKHYYEGTIPFIKTADVLNNRIKEANTFISQKAIDDYSLKTFPPGTLLMAMYGQGKTRGQVSLLEIAAATSQNAAAIQPSDEMHPAFLWHYLMSCYERLRGMGSLGHVSHLNLGYLRDLVVLKPPVEEQLECAKILDSLDGKISLHRQKRQVLEELFQSLLHKLMTGEIRVSELDLSALSTEVAV